MPGLYDWPDAYELAYAFRDVAREVEFALALAQRGLGRPVRAAVELGAGPASHARELARRGVRAFALDLEPGAADYLRAVAPEVTPLVADMRDWRLPEPVDLVLCPLGTFAYLLTDEDQHAALVAARDNLVPGGALVLELLPADAHRGAATAWTVRAGEREVYVAAGATHWVADDVYEWELRLTLRDAAGERTVAGRQRQRLVPAPACERRLRAAGFEQVRLYADWAPRRWRGELVYVITGTTTIIRNRDANR